MKHLSRWLCTAAITTGLALPAASFATNGMFLIGYGTKARGAGGVAIAMPQDSLAGAVNPATIGFVESRADVGADLFFPSAKVSLGDRTEKSQADLFLMPAMGGVYGFNRKITMGFSAVPYAGGGSRYNYNIINAQQPPLPTDQTLGVQLMVMQMNPTVAYKPDRHNSFGATLVFSVQTFRAFGLQQFETFSTDYAHMYNRGNDWAYGSGVRLGWMGNFLDKRLSLGAEYSSRVFMTKFRNYSGLFAEQGDLDTPGNIGAGISWKFTPDLTVGLDITRTFYSNVAAIGNTSAAKSGSPFYGDNNLKLGNPDGLGFGWDNQTVYKLGAIYDLNNQWTLRAGWNYGKSPIDESNGEILMSLLAPAVTQNHLTLGATYSPSRHTEFSFSYVHAFKYSEHGPTYIGGTGSMSMYQDSLGVSFGYKI